MPVKPKRIVPGDTIGVVSPSSPMSRRSELDRLRQWLELNGFQAKIFPHAGDKNTYLAGTDEDRAADVTAAFADPEVDAIMTMRGGTGAWRTVPYVDYRAVRDNPKHFVGFSDITALHLAIASEADLVTFYGPVGSSFIGRGVSSYTARHWLRAACEPGPLGLIEEDPGDPFSFSIRGGTVEAPLKGGCLMLLAQSLGTPWEVDWDGCIVFFEDTNEQPYRLDGYITQLKLAGKFDNVAGVVVGEMVQTGPSPHRPSYPYGTFSDEEVFIQHLEPLGVPVMVGLPCGHGRNLATLPLGVQARLDATNRTLEILEEATSE